MVLQGLDVPPHRGVSPQLPLRVSSTANPSASALMSCRSMPSTAVGVPTSLSSQSSLPTRTLASVPSHASQDPPPAAGAIAVGSASVSFCGAKLTTPEPRFTSVTLVTGEEPATRPQPPEGDPVGEPAPDVDVGAGVRETVGVGAAVGETVAVGVAVGVTVGVTGEEGEKLGVAVGGGVGGVTGWVTGEEGETLGVAVGEGVATVPALQGTPFRTKLPGSGFALPGRVATSPSRAEPPGPGLRSRTRWSPSPPIRTGSQQHPRPASPAAPDRT